MGEWLIPIVIIGVVLFYIGNLSTLQKNAKTPLRKKGLNDLKETLPRNNKTEHKLQTVENKPSSPYKK
ncbi:hypothetical protein WNY51_02000 [Pseudocolwellia sp. AS88]|jgi:hypothetical protein|uniref:hypothetical protein n=1 Tax=Pseudocolwellia TaxID=2848177 RepID=UPI0026F1BEED|nr:hypothetical protein [Pseudocolwellia sp. AS88]MDO7084598.1 hypothetical protein [Pseudocolwellia sp. AS88]